MSKPRLYFRRYSLSNMAAARSPVLARWSQNAAKALRMTSGLVDTSASTPMSFSATSKDMEWVEDDSTIRVICIFDNFPGIFNLVYTLNKPEEFHGW